MEAREVVERFGVLRTDFEIWLDQVLAVLRHDTVIASLRPVAASGRIKGDASLAEKVARKHNDNVRPISAENFTHEFTDLAGARLVLPSKSGIQRACERIRELEHLGYWRIDHVVITIWHPSEHRLLDKQFERFEPPEGLLYVGRHFVLEPNDHRRNETRRLACELQIRTVLEQGVLDVCHKAAYKKATPAHVIDQLNSAIESVQVLDETIRRIEQSLAMSADGT